MSKKTKISETLRNAVVETTDHGLLQLGDRYYFDSYEHIIDTDGIMLYPDVDPKSNVYYLNLIPTGFVVLRRIEKMKFAVITITLEENRNYGNPIHIIKPRLRERQGEYEQ